MKTLVVGSRSECYSIMIMRPVGFEAIEILMDVSEQKCNSGTAASLKSNSRENAVC